jgi:hypothetical protein
VNVTALTNSLLECVPARIPNFEAAGPAMALQSHSQVVWPDLQSEFFYKIGSDCVGRDPARVRLHSPQRCLSERDRQFFGWSGSSPPRGCPIVLSITTGFLRPGARGTTPPRAFALLFPEARQDPLGDFQLAELILQLGSFIIEFHKLVGNPLLFLRNIRRDRHLHSPFNRYHYTGENAFRLLVTSIRWILNLLRKARDTTCQTFEVCPLQ